MIEITQVSPPPDVHSLHTVGGFTWWYIDLTTPEGDGLVLVWALGLPFLPGSRAGRFSHSRPSLHVAVYRRGEPDMYLLQEYESKEAELCNSTGRGRIGGSEFMVEEQESGITVSVRLDVPIFQSHHRLTGQVDLAGPRVPLPTTSECPIHAWTPRTLAGSGTAELRCGAEERTLRGNAYFDGNMSTSPLHQQDIHSWRWGRISFADQTIVYYDVENRSGGTSCVVLSQDSDSGRFRRIDLSPSFSRHRRGNFGLMSPRRLAFELDHADYQIDLTRLVDDGPFYQRFLAEGTRTIRGGSSRADKQLGHGVAEVVRPGLIDLPWQRPFVRMKTERVGPSLPNSIFLPLFTGFTSDRAERLARSLFSGGRS